MVQTAYNYPPGPEPAVSSENADFTRIDGELRAVTPLTHWGAFPFCDAGINGAIFDEAAWREIRIVAHRRHISPLDVDLTGCIHICEACGRGHIVYRPTEVLNGQA